MTSETRVGIHKQVSLQYSLTTGGNIVIRSADSKPIQYVHGCGVLFPKLEAALEGRVSGDVLRVKLLPQDAFGRRDTELLQEVPLSALPPGEDIQVGGTLIGQDDAGTAIQFRVTAIENDLVKLDANHPLAGETLIFEIEVQSIRDASEAEISSAQQKTSTL